jgi:hypothetical protein
VSPETIIGMVIAGGIGLWAAWRDLGKIGRMSKKEAKAFEEMWSRKDPDRPLPPTPTKIGSDELVNLLNKWRVSKPELYLSIVFPEVTTILKVAIEKVAFPTVTVSLTTDARDDRNVLRLGIPRIDIHLSGCVLERCEVGDGVGTEIRASWLSSKGRYIFIAEKTPAMAGEN